MYKKWIGIGLICAVLAMGLEVYMVGVLWAEKATCEIYVAKRDLKTGALVTEQDLVKVEVAENQVVSGALKEGSKILKKKLTRDLVAGKILTADDFEKAALPEKIESIIVKLDYEQGHGGQLTAGEEVNVLCYRQGEVSLVENLVVRGTEKDLVNLGEGAYYVTLSGKSELLKSIVLAKREGSIHILKKTAVHN